MKACCFLCEQLVFHNLTLDLLLIRIPLICTFQKPLIVRPTIKITLLTINVPASWYILLNSSSGIGRFLPAHVTNALADTEYSSKIMSYIDGTFLDTVKSTVFNFHHRRDWTGSDTYRCMAAKALLNWGESVRPEGWSSKNASGCVVTHDDEADHVTC